jgi:hypothetical protein
MSQKEFQRVKVLENIARTFEESLPKWTRDRRAVEFVR